MSPLRAFQYVFARFDTLVPCGAALGVAVAIGQEFSPNVGILLGGPYFFVSPRWPDIWSISSVFSVSALGFICSIIFSSPFIALLGTRLINGAPFKKGDWVHILVGAHSGRTVQVYELWESRGQVRVELGDAAKSNVRDVFWMYQVCRERRHDLTNSQTVGK